MKVNTEKRCTMKLILKAIDTSIKIYICHLKMGGTNPDGRQINANNLYFTIAGKPILPVMGEFHFSRYPQDERVVDYCDANGIWGGEKKL